MPQATLIPHVVASSLVILQWSASWGQEDIPQDSETSECWPGWRQGTRGLRWLQESRKGLCLLACAGDPAGGGRVGNMDL